MPVKLRQVRMDIYSNIVLQFSEAACRCRIVRTATCLRSCDTVGRMKSWLELSRDLEFFSKTALDHFEFHCRSFPAALDSSKSPGILRGRSRLLVFAVDSTSYSWARWMPSAFRSRTTPSHHLHLVSQAVFGILRQGQAPPLVDAVGLTCEMYQCGEA